MSPAATNFEYANNTHVLCIFSVTDVKLLMAGFVLYYNRRPMGHMAHQQLTLPVHL